MRLAISAVCFLALAGCETTKETLSSTNQIIGAGVGAVAGGLIGNQIGSGSGRTVATIAGTLIGAGIGQQIAQYLTERDNQMVDQTAQSALAAPPGPTYAWSNPESGNSGAIMTTPVVVATSSSQECRTLQADYSTTGGSQSASPQVFCKQADGTWAPQAA